MLGLKKEDNVRYSNARTAIFYRGIDAVSDRVGVDFFTLDVEGQKKFLQERFDAVVKECVQIGGEEYENFHNFRVFIVENEGCAVLYFERKQ